MKTEQKFPILKAKLSFSSRKCIMRVIEDINKHKEQEKYDAIMRNNY